MDITKFLSTLSSSDDDKGISTRIEDSIEEMTNNMNNLPYDGTSYPGTGGKFFSEKRLYRLDGEHGSFCHIARNVNNGYVPKDQISSYWWRWVGEIKTHAGQRYIFYCNTSNSSHYVMFSTTDLGYVLESEEE